MGIFNALEFMLELGNKMGFETKNYDGYIGEIVFGEGEDFGILCHLDVVPAGDGWDTDPFKATIIDDKIYGRGAVDDKTPAVLILYALYELKKQGYKPNKKIKLILGCDEETSWRCIDYYNLKAKMPELGFSPDADFPIINVEKGILSFKVSLKDEVLKNIVSLNGGSAVNVVPNKCECVLSNSSNLLENLKNNKEVSTTLNNDNLILKSVGKSAHGSTPHLGENTIKKIVSFLGTYFKGSCFNTLNNLLFENGFLDKLDLNIADEVSGKLTLNVGVINLENDVLTLLIDVRYPVTFSGEMVIEKMQKAFSNTAKVEVIKHHTPLYVEEKSELIKKLQTAYELVTNEKAELKAIGGGTYSRALKQAVAFGPHFEGDEDVVHMANEYISIPRLVKTYDIYKKALELLCFS